MKYAILAGGSGTRLWPLSRQNSPKQFISLINDNSMLQNTALRVSKENGADVFIISGAESKFMILDQMHSVLSDFKEANILIEPAARNTAPAIAFSTTHMNDDDIVAILSSDHEINNVKEFNKALDQAGEIAAGGGIVTLGIIPDSPRTGYGYIKRSDTKVKSGYKVEKFVEKPDVETAKKYLADGSYYWNAGIFVFKVSAFLDELKKHAPDIYKTTLKIRDLVKTGKDVTREIYEEYTKISIDYALMEKSDNIYTIPAGFDWSDVGSFKSLYDILPKDENNNAVRVEKDDLYAVNAKNSLIMGCGRKIALIGIDNLSVIDTPDAILIADNKETEKVKEIADRLSKNGAKEALEHKTVYRPWGSYTILDEGPNYKVKQLYIRPEQKISLQYHHHRSENWTVVSGVAEVTKNEEIITLRPSETVFLPATVKHRLYNPSKVLILKVIEVQTGEYLGEDDIIRIDDDYERK